MKRSKEELNNPRARAFYEASRCFTGSNREFDELSDSAKDNVLSALHNYDPGTW